MNPQASAWAASGAMMLTGRRDGPPLGAPVALVDLIERAAAVLHRRSEGRISVNGLALLGERAALGNLARQGSISCGGSTRLVRATDGWLAVSLARSEDVAALAAWLCRDVPVADPWPVIDQAVADMSASVLDARAALLGLPIAALGSVDAPAHTVFDLPVSADLVQEHPGERLLLEGALVIDLSALWAGPLCAQLLAIGGAEVIKVESTSRPDAARHGPAPFFDLLNGLKRSVALDLRTARGERDLRRLLRAADIVIESARPRALEQMGIVATDELRQWRGPRVWASITSHGLGPEWRHRVGFGDVASAAGGLIVYDESGPCFIADAVADPLAGLIAAAAVLEALSAGGHWLIDVAMAPLAASAMGPHFDAAGDHAQRPRAREIARPAPAFGSDTAAVLSELLP